MWVYSNVVVTDQNGSSEQTSFTVLKYLVYSKAIPSRPRTKLGALSTLKGGVFPYSITLGALSTGVFPYSITPKNPQYASSKISLHLV